MECLLYEKAIKVKQGRFFNPQLALANLLEDRSQKKETTHIHSEDDESDQRPSLWGDCSNGILQKIVS